jgi:DNA-binding NarL/FixJ family response regulator
MKKLRLLIADDNESTRTNLADYLDLQKDMEVVAQTGREDEIPRLLQVSSPSVIILSDSLYDPQRTAAFFRNTTVPVQPAVILMTVFPSMEEICSDKMKCIFRCVDKSSGIEELLGSLKELQKTLE